MFLLDSIFWDADAVLVNLPVIDRPILWYGLLSGASFLLSRKLLLSIFLTEQQPAQAVERLAAPVLISALIGARMGHCFFFEPLYYLQHPIEIPAFWQGGMSGHGAVAGVLTGAYVYARKFQQNYLFLLDRLAIVAVLVACLLRIGNFMNADLIGIPTQSRYGVVFGHDVESVLEVHREVVAEVDIGYSQVQVDTLRKLAPLAIRIAFQPGIKEWPARSYLQHQVKAALTGHRAIVAQIAEPADEPLHYYLWKDGDQYVAIVETRGIPRHPVQLYEAVYSLLLFLLFYYGWRQRKSALPGGLLLGTFLVMWFGFKLINDFLAIHLAEDEVSNYLKMRQLLSIPFVAGGLVVLSRVHRRAKGNKPGKKVILESSQQ